MTIYKDVRYEADVAVSVATAILEGRKISKAQGKSNSLIVTAI